MSVLTLSY